MNESQDDPELMPLLRELGHPEDDARRIAARLRRYEKETHIDSIMDSMAQPGFDLDALIREALDEASD